MSESVEQAAPPKRPCVNRRTGCIGYAVPATVTKRETDGRLHAVVALICNKCGQAHGLAHE